MQIHLASGLAIRRGRVLLVASRYANHPEPLWNLPGGRQPFGELLGETVEREVLEETALRARAGELAYVSESYAGDDHVLNAVFRIVVSGRLRVPSRGDHVVDAAWVALHELRARLQVAVVREPLLRYLQGRLRRRYAGRHEAGITIRWPRGSE